MEICSTHVKHVRMINGSTLEAKSYHLATTCYYTKLSTPDQGKEHAPKVHSSQTSLLPSVQVRSRLQPTKYFYRYSSPPSPIRSDSFLSLKAVGVLIAGRSNAPKKIFACVGTLGVTCSCNEIIRIQREHGRARKVVIGAPDKIKRKKLGFSLFIFFLFFSFSDH